MAISGPLEHVLFNGKYAAYVWLMPLLALVPAANSFSIGYSMALRASQRPHFDLIANAIAAPVGLISGLAFMHWWGIGGAAGSMVLGFAVQGAVIFVCFQKFAASAGKASRLQPVTVQAD